jgi:hypothetical protein
VAQLRHVTVLADLGRIALLFGTDGFHLIVCLIRIGAGASTTAAVRASDPAKPSTILLVAGGDAVKGHEFEVVLMRADPKVGGARLRFGGADVIRYKEIGWL